MPTPPGDQSRIGMSSWPPVCVGPRVLGSKSWLTSSPHWPCPHSPLFRLPDAMLVCPDHVPTHPCAIIPPIGPHLLSLLSLQPLSAPRCQSFLGGCRSQQSQRVSVSLELGAAWAGSLPTQLRTQQSTSRWSHCPAGSFGAGTSELADSQ